MNCSCSTASSNGCPLHGTYTYPATQQQHPLCDCHDCTQIRYKQSMQSQFDKAGEKEVKPFFTDAEIEETQPGMFWNDVSQTTLYVNTKVAPLLEEVIKLRVHKLNSDGVFVRCEKLHQENERLRAENETLKAEVERCVGRPTGFYEVRLNQLKDLLREAREAIDRLADISHGINGAVGEALLATYEDILSRIDEALGEKR